jgi:hypothetical protein
MKFKTKMAVVMLSMASVSAQADTIFSQAWDGTGYSTLSEQDLSSPNSPNGTFGDFSKNWDNFSFNPATTSSAAITGVSWYGSYDAGIAAQNPTFLVQIWADNGAGIVNTTAPLFSESFASANETFVDSTAAKFASAAAENYQYSVNLASAFDATAGVTYWLSIQAGIYMGGASGSDFTPLWYWNTAYGSGGDGKSYYDYANTIYAPTTPRDFAYSLTGTLQAVPVPSAIWLFGSALAGLGLLRKKAIA